jgi:MFS family permease
LYSNATLNLERVQRRSLLVLAAAQILGGVGVAAGIAVSALLVADMGSDSLSGLASACSVIGAAVIAVPVAQVMNVSGRRAGLMLAYGLGTVGALLVVTGAALGTLLLTLPGLTLAGGGTAAGLQSRYAAADLATAERRGRALATVVWATTIGSVLGPNLAQPTGDFAEALGAPRLAGPFMLTSVAFVIAGGLIAAMLCPDPLLVARAEASRVSGGQGAEQPLRKSVPDALREIALLPSAVVGLVAMSAGHAVMVGVMSMTPVHLHHGDASLRVIGLVISGHVAGMYIASPIIGTLADRFGRHVVIVAGSALLFAAVLVAGLSPSHAPGQVALGLGLLGLGWSCTLIAGSTLLTEAVAMADRPSAQGAADFVMGVAGASAGVLSGVVVGFGSYGLLNLMAGLLVATLLGVSVRDMRRPAMSPLPLR